MERRPAAILVADVAGQTRLMENDEAGTLDALKAHWEEFIEPTGTDHKGSVVKLMGDRIPAVVRAQGEAGQNRGKDGLPVGILSGSHAPASN